MQSQQFSSSPPGGARSIEDFPIVARFSDWSRRSPAQGDCRCPAHEDSRSSLSIGITDKGDLGLHCHAGCNVGDVLRSVGAVFSDLFYLSAVVGQKFRSRAGRNGQQSTDSWPSASSSQSSKNNNSRGRKKEPNPWIDSKIVDVYPYHDASGREIFQVVRFEPKDFRQRHYSPTAKVWPRDGGRWVFKGVDESQRVLFNLPAILASPLAAPIFLVEGEKDAKRLITSGLLATTAPGGAASGKKQARKWLAQYTETLRGRPVYIIPDRDLIDPKTGRRAGWQHVIHVANALYGVAALVTVLELPELPGLLGRKWDISNWLDHGGTKQQFFDAVTAAGGKPWDPAAQENQPMAAIPDGPNEAQDDPHRLARLYLDRYQHTDGLTLRYWRESFWRWDGRAYRQIQTTEIRAELAQSIKQEFDRLNLEAVQAAAIAGDDPPLALKVTGRLTSDVMHALQGITLLPGAIEQPAWLDETGMEVDHERHRRVHDYVTMRNGILDLQNLLTDNTDDSTAPPALLGHSPRFFCPISLPYDFDPTADCPTWQRFVAHNLESDPCRMDMLQEWFGYCLTFDTSMQKFLLMEGEGSNGKSVICAALTAILGLENVCHVALEVWGQSFVLTQTLGKLANVVSEVGEIDKMAEGYLKSFTGGDRMTFNRKNQSLIEAAPTARLVLATNNRPRFSDRSGGIWRRMLMLPLQVQITDAEKVHGMDRPAFWDRTGELPGMFCWAVAGLHRLRQQKRFTESIISAQALDEYRSESNPARLFLKQFYEESITGYVVTKDVYREYREWCESNNYRALSSNIFGKEIRRAFPLSKEVQRTVPVMDGGILKSPRVRCYDGVQQKEDADRTEMAPDTSQNFF